VVVSNNKLGLIVTGLMIGLFIVSIDNTIVATAMGTVIADLGGLDKFVWVTSAYMVAEMAGMPIFGKLSDMYGRKRFFLSGLIVFLLGSLLCGTAHNIVQLALYRALQGLGGGAMAPIAFTIVFDVFPPEKRGKMSALFGSVFGLSSIVGPLLGAYITDHVNWRWIFYINLPLGLIALALVLFNYRESFEHMRQKIDWWGAITLVGATVALMFALELGGQQYAWGSGFILGLFAAFVILLAAFLLAERKAEEPIVAFPLFKRRLFAASNAVGLFYGATFIVAAVYIPIFVQGVQGGTATNSGLVLLPYMLSSVIGATIGGIIVGKFSYRSIMLFSAVIFVLGTYLLSTIAEDTARLLLSLYMLIAGFGLGFSFSILTMAPLHNLDARQRGAANSTLAFIRSLGMTVSITIYGVIQRNTFTSQLNDALSGSASTGTEAGIGTGTGAGGGQALQGGAFADPRMLLSPEARAHMPQPVLEKLTGVLSSSIGYTFVWALVPAALALVAVLSMSGERMIPDDGQAGGEAAPATGH
jgi:EmrB/QacA subfamily drug resistance transporter